ncbi:N-formylglutamate amidohydrolase [Pontixanthobacter sp.]|uniref:N-formylglutamate amidohydrolase n=1 Tax=Pontixanthobacter sp. TaxID=2792078 RepID=UPI003C7BB17D
MSDAPLISPDTASPARGDSLGGTIPGTRKSAFALSIPSEMPIPVLIAAPHAGRQYPEYITALMRQPDYSKIRLEDRYVDHIASRAARMIGGCLLIAHAPRAMLDLNRAIDDVDWSMVVGGAPEGSGKKSTNHRAKSGLGLVPRRLAGVGEIWREALSPDGLKQRVDHIHGPYHTALAQTLATIRDRWGAALLIDVHSMPPLKKSRPEERTAHFVIGDRFGGSADDRLVASAIQMLGQEGATVAHNRPYAGGYVLDRHARPARNIHAIQIEICRSLYLDTHLSRPTTRMDAVAQIVGRLARQLGKQVADLGRESGTPLAAE